MKTTTALYIREDGKILIGEWPEPIDHPCEQMPGHDCPMCIGYLSALKESIDKAVEVAPEQQVKAEGHIFANHAPLTLLGFNYSWIPEKNTLYPIPGVRYEVRWKDLPYNLGVDKRKDMLAYIISPPALAKEPEYQESLWEEVDLILGGSFGKTPDQVIKELKEKFLITRREQQL